MHYLNNFTLTIIFVSLFLLSSTEVLSESDTDQHKYEKQNVQKLESGRTNQLKRDADPKGRTEENKGNFDLNVPRGDGVEYPPAKNSELPAKNLGK